MPKMLTIKESMETKNNSVTRLVDVLVKHPDKILYAFLVITVLFMIFDI